MSGNAQVIHHAPNLPLPERLRTSFTCEADYKIPVSTASITSGAVKLNSPYLPFRPSGATAFPSFTFQGPATEATLLPTGWSQLANANLYKFFKVVKSTIMVRISGTLTANNCVVTVIPSDNATSFSNIYTARAAPLARQSAFCASKPNMGTNRQGWSSYSIDPYVLYSGTRLEAKADVSLAGTYNVDPLLVAWWFVFLQTNDLDITATSASLLQVRVRYDVELFEPSQMSVT